MLIVRRHRRRHRHHQPAPRALDTVLSSREPAYGPQVTLPFTGLAATLTVWRWTAAGNVYVADTGNNRVLKLAAGSSTQTVLPFTGLNGPYGVAVDTAGTVYVADTTTIGW